MGPQVSRSWVAVVEAGLGLRVHVAALIFLPIKPFSGLGSQTQIFTV